MSEARIHTRSFEFPRKLYQIGPMGLKDGLEVDFLKIGGLFLVAWFAALTVVFGLPTQVTFPPVRDHPRGHRVLGVHARPQTCATPSPGGLDACRPLRPGWPHPDCGREASGRAWRCSHSP